MRARTWLSLAAIVDAAAAVAVWWTQHDDAPRAPRAGAPAGGSNPPALQATPRPRLPERVQGDLPAAPAGAEQPIEIDPDDVLAEVNGVAIKLGDLMVVEPGVTDPQPVDPTMLRYLL